MKALKIKHIAPYLAYKVEVEYEGIINGSELSKQKKELQKNSKNFLDSQLIGKPIKEIIGTKRGLIKDVKIFKNYFTVYCGIKHGHLKAFYNGNGFKLVLHPISKLTQEIEVNGEKFVPIEWFEIGDDDSGIEYDHGNVKLIKTLESIARHNNFHDVEFLPFSVVQKLFEWHFDVFGLISNDLAVSH